MTAGAMSQIRARTRAGPSSVTSRSLDATGREPEGRHDILVEDGRISRIGVSGGLADDVAGSTALAARCCRA